MEEELYHRHPLQHKRRHFLWSMKWMSAPKMRRAHCLMQHKVNLTTILIIHCSLYAHVPFCSQMHPLLPHTNHHVLTIPLHSMNSSGPEIRMFDVIPRLNELASDHRIRGQPLETWYGLSICSFLCKFYNLNILVFVQLIIYWK